MLKCPYCFEVLEAKVTKCPVCGQFLIDNPVETDFKSLDKKKCVFCGKKIFQEAKICKHCRKWLDEVDKGASSFDDLS